MTYPVNKPVVVVAKKSASAIKTTLMVLCGGVTLGAIAAVVYLVVKARKQLTSAAASLASAMASKVTSAPIAASSAASSTAASVASAQSSVLQVTVPMSLPTLPVTVDDVLPTTAATDEESAGLPTSFNIVMPQTRMSALQAQPQVPTTAIRGQAVTIPDLNELMKKPPQPYRNRAAAASLNAMRLKQAEWPDMIYSERGNKPRMAFLSLIHI